MVSVSDVVLILVAVIFPPAAALFITGCSCDFLINLCLTILGYLPGLLHSFWLIYKKMEAEEQYGLGGFQYVGNGQYEPIYSAPPAPAPAIPPPQAPVNYGATGSNYVR